VSLARKLQLSPSQPVFLAGCPPDVSLELPGAYPVPTDSEDAAAIFFCVDRSALEQRRRHLVEAARRDRLVWLAYPKAGRLGTDLNRDTVAALLADDGVRPVRQIAIDDTWSALRFRPGAWQGG
jgi:hypothetical protein